VTRGVEPPPSKYPTLAAGDLVAPDTAAMGFPKIPGVPSPEQNPLLQYDFGPHFKYLDVSGIIDVQPSVVLRRLPSLVPRVDADGNELAGVRSPLLQAPLGTYTGWNMRARGHGHGLQARFEGSYIPFADSPQERQVTGDPRPSILERYPDKAAYVAAITAAARELVAQGLMLEEDVTRCAEAAADWGRPRHDVALG
jgi:hypothetical protein